MMVHQNPTPWVVLAVLVMAGCAMTGMMMGNVGPFNSRVVEAEIPARQTKSAIELQATQSAMEIAQTQQAPLAQQTAMAAQLTLAPMQQAVTQAAGAAAVQEHQIQATQTALANHSILENLAGNATATAIARDRIRDTATDAAGLGILGIGIVLVSGLVLTYIVVQIINARANARAREREAEARRLAEQRRLVALRASLEAQRRQQTEQYTTPNSLMKKPGNGKGLPRAE